jgi:hypothetical protein
VTATAEASRPGEARNAVNQTSRVKRRGSEKRSPPRTPRPYSCADSAIVGAFRSSLSESGKNLLLTLG